MTTKQHNQVENIQMETTIAVIGDGYAGLAAAATLAQNGYPVILAGSENDATLHGASAAESEGLNALKKQVGGHPSIDVLPHSALIEAAGVSGDFSLTFMSEDRRVEKKAGAIVIATDLSSAPLTFIYGLTPSNGVVSLSEMEALLASETGRKEISDKKKTIAFLVGFAHEGNPLLMQRVLESVQKIVGMEGCTAYVYVNNLKVAEDGLERMYKQSRDNGAIYFKLQSAPMVSQTDGDLRVTFYDPVIRNDIELSPDMLVIEESLVSHQQNVSLAEILRIDLGPAGFLQKENVHRLPVNTNREGIFVVGGSRDVQNTSKALADVDNMLLRVKQLIGDTAKTVTAKAVVDREKCTICLTCYRCCPHGAIYWDDKAVISPVACQGCGICASECPMDAIQLNDFTDTEMISRIKEAAAAKTETRAPKIIAFCCQNSAFEAGTAAGLFHYDLPAGLQVIKIPCAGKVDINYILNALVEGADGVIVMACHTGNCKSESGNTYAKWRINDAYRKLEQIGIPKDRLEFATLASNMASDFARIVIDMEKRISQK